MEKAFVSTVLITSPIATEGYGFNIDERITNSLGILDVDGAKTEIVLQSKRYQKLM